MIERYQLIQNIWLIILTFSSFLVVISTYYYSSYSGKITELKGIEQKKADDKIASQILDSIKSNHDKVIDEIKEIPNHIYAKSAEHTGLTQQLNDLKKLIQASDNETERMKYDFRLQEAEKNLKKFEEDVIQLAKLLTRTEFRSSRINSAKLLFDKGKFKEADLALNSDEMFKDLKRLEAIENREKDDHKNKLQDFEANRIQLSNEYLMKAKLATLDLKVPDIMNKAYIFYQQSLAINKNLENTLSFASFLRDYNYPEAINMFEEALKICEISNLKPTLDHHQIIYIQNNLGLLYADKFEFDSAKLMYNKVIRAYQNQQNLNQSYDGNLALANVYTNLANLYFTKEDITESKKYYDLSSKMLRKGLTINSNYKPALASNLMNCGISGAYDSDQSQNFIHESVMLYKDLVKSDSTYLPLLAKAMTNYGVLAKKAGVLNLTRYYYEEALKIRETLYNQNPYKFGEDLSYTLANYGNFLRRYPSDRILAIKYLDESLRIRRNLSALNPDRFSYQISQSLYNIGWYYAEERNYSKAIKAMDEVVKILKPLSNKSTKFKKEFDESVEDLNRFKQLNKG